MSRAHGLPCGPIPCPCVVEPSVAPKAAKEDDLPVYLVVGHARSLSRSWACGQALVLRPGRAIPGPGVIKERLSCNTAEKHDIMPGLVVGHRRDRAPERKGARGRGGDR